MLTLPLLLAAIPLLEPQEPNPAPAALVVHEWGTFTCLLDARGSSIAGVNTEDEPLPAFVHRPVAERLGEFLLPSHDLAPCFFQGAPACHPDVTMRLETPVIYFHPAEGSAAFEVDVAVEWRGGWLSEFYPNGEVELPGLEVGPLGTLAPDAKGSLRWRAVQVGGDVGVPPPTEAPVWLAPRRVAAADLRVGEEAERFLFYRGVGNVASPLAISTVAGTDDLVSQLVIESRIPAALAREGIATGPAWLVDIDPERGCAFRALPALPIPHGGKGELARVRAEFAPEDYGPARGDALKAAMHRALCAAGLFDDEARALLDTWQVSYFESPGLRLFCIVPRAWTDATMPLRLSVPATIERVMIARIELIGPRQRTALAQIAAGPTSSSAWLQEFMSDQVRKDPANFARIWGEMTSRPGGLLAVPGLAIPADYRAWLALGRFRQAIVRDALESNPSEGLSAFANAYGLQR